METYYSYFGDLHELTLRQEMREITYIPALKFENKEIYIWGRYVTNKEHMNMKDHYFLISLLTDYFQNSDISRTISCQYQVGNHINMGFDDDLDGQELRALNKENFDNFKEWYDTHKNKEIHYNGELTDLWKNEIGDYMRTAGVIICHGINGFLDAIPVEFIS